MRLTTILFLLLGLSLSAQDGYQVGDEAMGFNLMNVDGNMVSPEQFEDAKGFIIVFTCNHCPFSVKYEDRIMALHERFSDKGFPVIAINPNDAEAYPSDSYDGMVQRAEEKGFEFRYLHDESQEIAKAYGATRTPHTFVVEKVEGKMMVRYIGAIDDNVDGSDVGEEYVFEAVTNLLDGGEVELASTKAVGCSIKWKK
jgi:peroxiredoxin